MSYSLRLMRASSCFSILLLPSLAATQPQAETAPAEPEISYKCRIVNDTGAAVTIRIKYLDYKKIKYQWTIPTDGSVVTDPAKEQGLDAGTVEIEVLVGNKEPRGICTWITGPSTITLLPSGGIEKTDWPAGRGISYPQLRRVARHAVKYHTIPSPEVVINNSAQAFSANVDTILRYNDGDGKDEIIILRAAAVGLEALRLYASETPSRSLFWKEPISKAESHLESALLRVQQPELRPDQCIELALNGRAAAELELVKAVSNYARANGKRFETTVAKHITVSSYVAAVSPRECRVSYVAYGDYLLWNASRKQSLTPSEIGVTDGQEVVINKGSTIAYMMYTTPNAPAWRREADRRDGKGEELYGTITVGADRIVRFSRNP